MTTQSDDYQRRLDRIEGLLDEIEKKMEMVVRHDERFSSYLQGMARLGDRLDRHEIEQGRMMEEFRVRLRDVESRVRVVYAISAAVGAVAVPVLINTVLKWL